MESQCEHSQKLTDTFQPTLVIIISDICQAMQAATSSARSAEDAKAKSHSCTSGWWMPSYTSLILGASCRRSGRAGSEFLAFQCPVIFWKYLLRSRRHYCFRHGVSRSSSVGGVIATAMARTQSFWRLNARYALIVVDRLLSGDDFEALASCFRVRGNRA